MAYLLVWRGPLKLPPPRRRMWGPPIDSGRKFLHTAGIKVPALRALVVRLDRQHLHPDPAASAHRALRVGVDGAGGGCRLGFDVTLYVMIGGVGHGASIPDGGRRREAEVSGCGARARRGGTRPLRTRRRAAASRPPDVRPPPSSRCCRSTSPPAASWRPRRSSRCRRW